MLKNIEQIINVYEITSLKDYLQKIKQLSDTKTISVAVLGGFKAGKSSFLNAVVRKDILPVGVLPTTNVLTKISDGDNLKITVDTDENSFDTTPEQLPQYLTEKQNPENRKQVKSVRILLPGIEKGLEFVDTPGTGSFFRSNTDTALNWTPESTFVVYAINPQQPFSEQDIQNLKTILEYTGKVYLLLTKVDLLSPAERDEMAQYINEVSQAEFGRVFPLFFFSTKKDKDKYLSIIKTELLLPLMSQKQENLNELIAYKTTVLRNNVRQYLELVLETIRQEHSAVEQLKKEIESEKAFLEQIHQELGLIAKEYTAHTRESLEELLLKSGFNNLKTELQHSFSSEYYRWKGNLYKRTRFFEQWLQKELNQSLKKLFTDNKEGIEALTTPVRQHFERQVILFRDRINTRVEPVLHKTIPEFLWQIPKPELRKPDIAVSWTFDSNIDLLWWLFPMPLWKKYFFRFFRKRIPAEVEKNLYRLISQITEMVNTSINRMQTDTRDFLFGEYRQIKTLLNIQRFDEPDILKDLKTIEKLEENS